MPCKRDRDLSAFAFQTNNLAWKLNAIVLFDGENIYGSKHSSRKFEFLRKLQRMEHENFAR
jgi:hypothetical protein